MEHDNAHEAMLDQRRQCGVVSLIAATWVNSPTRLAKMGLEATEPAALRSREGRRRARQLMIQFLAELKEARQEVIKRIITLRSFDLIRERADRDLGFIQRCLEEQRPLWFEFILRIMELEGPLCARY